MKHKVEGKVVIVQHDSPKSGSFVPWCNPIKQLTNRSRQVWLYKIIVFQLRSGPV